MRSMKLILASLMLMALCVVSHAGWFRVGGVVGGASGKTTWISDRPSPVTFWVRAQTAKAQTDLYPTPQPHVFVDSRKIYQSSSSTLLDTGLWDMDEDGNYMPKTITQQMYDNQNDTAGGTHDVEWLIDSDLNIYPRP